MKNKKQERIRRHILGIKKNLISLHDEFIDIMYPEFGLPTRPASAKVEIEIYGRNRGEITVDNEIIIYLDNNNSQEDADATCLHESGHYLHALRNPSLKERDRERRDELSHHLLELVAEVSTIQFLDRTGRKYQPTQVNYYNVAVQMYQNKKLPLLSDLSGMNVEEASNIVREYQRRLEQKI